jgi:hypothetical protein
LAVNGKPKTLEQLREHQAVNFLSSATGRSSPFEFIVDGSLHSVTLRGRASVTTAEAYRARCRQGLGLIQTPRFGVEDLVASGDLVEVLGAYRPSPMPVSVMFAQQRQMTRPRSGCSSTGSSSAFRHSRSHVATLDLCALPQRDRDLQTPGLGIKQREVAFRERGPAKLQVVRRWSLLLIATQLSRLQQRTTSPVNPQPSPVSELK